ncbi:MAG: hypothetical protein IKX40_07055 [Thermoguttaceae bacterium]|nr:hypothetical protein [Thermoguttaceae bacterium]
MKNQIILLVLFSTFATPLFADSQRDRPYIPISQSRTTTVIAGVATAHNSAFLSDSVLAPTLMFSSTQPKTVLNHVKGDLGEMMMDRFFAKEYGWARLTPTTVGRTGIDGLYVKMDSSGNPRSLLVADAKVNSANLKQTKNGKQMSRQWSSPHLSRTADSYRKLAIELRNKNTSIIRAKSIPDDVLLSKIIDIPIDNNGSVRIWKTSNGYVFYSSNSVIDRNIIRQQAEKTAIYLKGAADGKIEYRSRLFRYKVEGGEHVIYNKKLDPNANIIKSESGIYKIPAFTPGKYDKNPRFAYFQKYVIEPSIKDALLEKKNLNGLPKYSGKSLQSTLNECCQKPERLNEICVHPKITPASVRIATTIGTATVFAAGLDALTQYLTTGEIDWRRMGTVTLLTGTSTAVGLAATSGLQALGCSTAISSIGGVSVMGVVMAYGLYAMGYCSLSDAHFNAAIGVATGAIVATPAIMTAIAVTWGTTSTGVAISSLSGAAMTNAVLAWWGGGAIAAGGGGMAAGGTTIILATGGVAIVVVAIPVAIMTFKYFADSANQHRYLQGMIDIVSDRVRSGDQIEWTHLRLAPR